MLLDPEEEQAPHGSCTIGGYDCVARPVRTTLEDLQSTHTALRSGPQARRSCHKFSPPHRMHRLRSASLGLLASQTSRSSPSTAVGLELAAAAVGTSRAKSSLSTDFLGVPTNHDELQSKRPMSPHLFGVDNR
jgi:hypothetical protein